MERICQSTKRDTSSSNCRRHFSGDTTPRGRGLSTIKLGGDLKEGKDPYLRTASEGCLGSEPGASWNKKKIIGAGWENLSRVIYIQSPNDKKKKKSCRGGVTKMKAVGATGYMLLRPTPGGKLPWKE